MTGVRFKAGEGIFLFNAASRPTLGPTHPPIQWVSRDLPRGRGVKRQVPEADYSPPYRVEVKNEWSCTSTPLHGLVLCKYRMLLHGLVLS